MSTEPNVSPEQAHASAHLSGNGRIAHSPLIVVGMHRSGTSFVASLLHAAGLDMGSRLMPAARSNERGHFENMDFVEFHMRELRLSGHDDSGWSAPQSLLLPEEAASEAREIVQTNARSSAWGWKDPRTTLFLDFWSSVVPDANYLYIFREPSEVIDSLYRRGDESIQLSPELAVRAYLTHNEMMLQHARKNRARSFVANVSAIALDPQRFLVALAEKFDIDVDANVPSTFEDGLMRTTASEAPRAALLRQVSPELDRLYHDLERETDLPSATGENKRESANKVKEGFFNDWLLDRKREAELQRENAELTTQLKDARAAIDELHESNTKRGEHLEEAERLLASERASHEEIARELTAQTEALIAEVRAESEKVALLIATVQSSSFWKIKRGLNRVRRFFYLDRR
jgi:O-antigen biosynthesis protein